VPVVGPAGDVALRLAAVSLPMPGQSTAAKGDQARVSCAQPADRHELPSPATALSALTSFGPCR